MKNKLNLHLFLTGLILVISLSDLSAQMKFRDLVRHPVFTHGDEGEWDDEFVWNASIIRDGDTLRMWYHGSSGNFGTPYYSNIGYAWSLDGIEWNKYDGNPVLTSTLSWEGGWVENPTVIKDGDTFKMWYDAMDRGYAESFDGINWTKHIQPLTLTEGPQSEWDDGFLWVNAVIKEDNEYKMWYSGGRPGFPESNSYPQVGFATSPDGINWTKYDDPTTQNVPYAFSDPVLEIGEGDDWDLLRAFVPRVVKTDTGFTMFYTGVKGPLQTNVKQQIGQAYSTDGIHWTKDEHNPMIKDDHSVVAWGGGIYTGTALYFDDRFHVWFGCENNPPDERRPQIGYAVQLTSCLPESFEFTTQAEIDSFQTDCNNCNEVVGDVTINGADITNLNGLSNLTSIGGNLCIDYNTVLTSLTGLENLTSIQGGKISIGSDDDEAGNPSLVSLAGLENIDANAINELVILYNSSLSNCDIESICDYLASPNATVDIHDNATGCNSQEEVVAACAESVDEISVFDNFSVYPNPASGIFNLQFTVYDLQRISLKIYDLHGREMATVVDEVMQPGEHRVSFDTSQLPPGVYIYHQLAAERSDVSTRSGSAVGKLVVVR